MHCMRQTDISYTLTVVLHALCPPASKTAPVTAHNLKSASEMRAGSFTFLGRDNKLSPVVSKSVYQVGFLGNQKISLTLFNHNKIL